MCGIAGVIGNQYKSITKVVEKIDHRGPDHTGIKTFDENQVGLAHKRLSIIDLNERSNQPFCSEDHRYWLIFNGEIYNYLLLKERLEKLGYTFQTTSDTETLLYWLIENGTSGISELDGMFAFAFYDSVDQTMILARDFIGKKPLYYSNFEGQLVFCSEIKGLLELEGVDKRVNEKAIREYLRFLYIPSPLTMYAGINELEPGYYMTYDLKNHGLIKKEYINIVEMAREAKKASENNIEGFRKFFLNGVKKRLMADVPVSIYLSGGLDSNTILAAAKNVDPNYEFFTYTLEYGGSKAALEQNESEITQKSAKYFNVPISVLKLNDNLDFLENLKLTIELFDQPFGNSTSISSEIIASEVCKNHKVALVGDGGDELAIGYPRYKALLIHKKFSWLPNPILKLISAVVKILPFPSTLETKKRRILQFLTGLGMSPSEAFLHWSTYLSNSELTDAVGDSNSDLYSHLKSVFEEFIKEPLKAATLVDLLSFVPFNLMQSADRTSMHNHLELRCPFLDRELIKFTLSLPDKARYKKSSHKYLIREAFGELLPGFILKQPKKPFNPPINDIVRNNFYFIQSYILGVDSVLPSYVNRNFVETVLAEFKSGKRQDGTFIWGISLLECWLRKTRELYA